MNFIKKIFGNNSNECRHEAMMQGISVSDVEREIPIFDLGNDNVKLEKSRCIRYSIPKMSNSSFNWQFLQRTEKEGSQFTNGYLLKTKDGEAPTNLEEQLHKVANEFDEEYFEFEGTSTEVAVYWDEWGGKEQVQRLYEYLEKLSRAY